MYDINTSLTDVEGVQVYDGWAVKSDDYENAWFVATQLQGEGFDTDAIAVFASGAFTPEGEFSGGGLLFSVGSISETVSAMGSGEDTDAELTMDRDGVDEAVQCVKDNRLDPESSILTTGMLVLHDPETFVTTESQCISMPVESGPAIGTDVTITANDQTIHAFTSHGVPLEDGSCTFMFTQRLPDANTYSVSIGGVDYPVDRTSMVESAKSGPWIFEIPMN